MPDDESRPIGRDRTAPQVLGGTHDHTCLDRLRNAHRNRRREAAYLLWVEPEPRPEPCSYGLTARELEAEAERLIASGWHPFEVRERLVDPRLVAA